MEEQSNKWKDLISSFGYGFVDDIKQYESIVNVFAYKDMQPRTIKGLKEFRENINNDKKLRELFEKIAKGLCYFIFKEKIKNQEDFDNWHKKICKNFVKEFNDITKNKIKEISFGKAQKLINVSLKYIFCLKGADKYISKFEYCHMILDRYTYSEGFYKLKVIDWYNKKNSNGKIKKALTAWSNLEFEEYNKIQKNIRDYLNSNDNDEYKGLTPFQAEFYIFKKYAENINI